MMKDRVVQVLTVCSFSGLVLIEALLETEVNERLYLPDEIAALVAAILVGFAYGLVSKYVFVQRESRILLLLRLIRARWDAHREQVLAAF